MDELIASLTPGQVLLVCIGAILALAGFINSVGAALDRVEKWRKAAHAPNEAQDELLEDYGERIKKLEAANLAGRVGDLEKWQTEAKTMLGNDKLSLDKINQGLDKINQGLEASFQTQLALLDHSLHGNNLKQMQDARDGLYDYLTHPNKRKE
jgi:hypothetical protein